MNLEYIYEQMVRILHGNITCISESGAIEACYGDMAVKVDVFHRNNLCISAACCKSYFLMYKNTVK